MNDEEKNGGRRGGDNKVSSSHVKFRGIIIVDRKNPYNSPSPCGRELEGGGMYRFHPHLNLLPSRERNSIRGYAEDHISLSARDYNSGGNIGN